MFKGYGRTLSNPLEEETSRLLSESKFHYYGVNLFDILNYTISLKLDPYLVKGKSNNKEKEKLHIGRLY